MKVKNYILHGIGIFQNVIIGKTFLYLPEKLIINHDKQRINIKEELRVFEKAVEKSKLQIKALMDRIKGRISEKDLDIFNSHLLILEDPIFLSKVKEYINNDELSAENAVKKAENYLEDLFSHVESNYIRLRINDIKDVCDRVIRNILGKPKPDLSSLPYPAIVVAEDLTPSDTAALDRENVLGFATDKGSLTSHTAILAEALGIPAVVGLKEVTKCVKNGDVLILDGEKGIVIVDPDEETLERYRKRKEKIEKEEKLLDKVKFLPIFTKTGKRIEISANIGRPEEADMAIKSGAEGIGLFRTEFLFLDRREPPSEEEQFKAYKSVIEKFKDKPVIIRTLDIGGDKQIPYLNLEKELNPFLGVRAIRLCLKRKDLFKTQLKAILRAGVFGNVKIMYPMIAVKDEIVEANNILEEVKKELKKEGKEFKENIEVGIMIEIPSAALMADELIKYVDFFSIGTNDLIQYTFAADRTNENVSYLYRPLSDAILNLIKMTIDASHKYGKWTGVCGEMAGDTKAIPELIKLGIDELSMTPQKIPKAKFTIMNLNY